MVAGVGVVGAERTRESVPPPAVISDGVDAARGEVGEGCCGAREDSSWMLGMVHTIQGQ